MNTFQKEPEIVQVEKVEKLQSFKFCLKRSLEQPEIFGKDKKSHEVPFKRFPDSKVVAKFSLITHCNGGFLVGAFDGKDDYISDSFKFLKPANSHLWWDSELDSSWESIYEIRTVCWTKNLILQKMEPKVSFRGRHFI